MEEGVRSLLSEVPQRGLCRRLHGRRRAVLHEVDELLYGLRRVCGTWHCGSSVVKGVLGVVVLHCLCLPEPGLRGFWCVLAVVGSLGPVECRVEGLPRGPLSACDSGGLKELLQASWEVFWVYFLAVGLACHEDPVCPVKDPPLGVRFEDVDGGKFGGMRGGCPKMQRLFPFRRDGGEGWPCGVGADQGGGR